MKHPTAVLLAKRLLDSRLKRPAGIESDSSTRISEIELAWAQELLATHLEACLAQGIHPDLSEAVEEALDFAIRREKAYEPPPPVHSYLEFAGLEEFGAEPEGANQSLSDANADTFEERLAKAQTNRELMGVLIDEDWLGLKLLAFLRSSTMTAAELASATKASLDKVELTLDRLRNFKAVQSLTLPGSRTFICLESGAKLLANIELSTGISLTPSSASGESRYEPAPKGWRWQGPLALMEERDAD